ncbi:MAG: hypothetical protein P1V97_18770, partial [Planctomycetota bacterium]|nr:hypothetical protein [Planctomycetota bacterium]
MSESQKVSLTARESVSKCIYCHEMLDAAEDSFRTCPGCSACIHTECDTTGICLIPGCGLKFELDKNSVSISPRTPANSQPYQNRAVATFPSGPNEPIQYPRPEGLGFLTKIWFLCTVPIYIIWFFWNCFPPTTYRFAAHRLGIV